MGLWKAKYNKDVLLAGVITFLPFLIYIHLIFDNSQEELVIFGLQIHHRFISNEQFIWNIMLKIIPIILFCIWFITTNYKWRHLILIPITVYFDSFIRYTFLSNKYSEFEGVIISVPANLLLLFLLMVMARFYQIKYGDDIRWVRISRILSFESKKNFMAANEFIDRAKEKSVENINSKYFQNLLLLKDYLEQQVLSPKELKSDIRINKKFIYLIITALLSIPVLFNLHRFVPDNVEHLDLKIISISSYGFPSVDILVWLLFLKLTFLISLSIWFITCQYWWKYAILSPIVLVSYQIWEMFQDVRYIDAWGNLRAFPFILFNIVTLVVLSNYIKYEFKVSDLQEAISRELDEMIGNRASTQQIDLLKDQLRLLKANTGKKGRTAEKNLEALIKMREQLLKDLEVNC
jgi:hypothetical protein